MITILLFGIFLLLLSLILIILIGKDRFIGLLIIIGIILGFLLSLAVAGLAFLIFVMPKLEEQGISGWSTVGLIVFTLAIIGLPWLYSTIDSPKKVEPERLHVHFYRGANYVQVSEFLDGDRGVNEWEERIGRKVVRKVGPMRNMVVFDDWQEYLRYRNGLNEQ